MIRHTPVYSGVRPGPFLGEPRRAGLAGGFALGCLLGAFGLLGCQGVENMRPDVAVSISGEELLYSQFESFLDRQLGENDLDLGSEALSGLFDQFLDEQLLIRLAVERGLVDGPVDHRRALAYLLRDFRFEPGEAELRAYYNAHRGDFERPEQVRLRVILVPERELAEQAATALEDEDFAEVAARFSQGPTAHLGGDQGVLSRQDLSSVFADIIFALEVGEVSDIVEADYGFQIFQVTEHRAASKVPFDEAHETIRRELLGRRMDEQLASLLAEARERYNVRVFRGNLPFEYRGVYGSSGHAESAARFPERPLDRYSRES